MPKPTYVEVTQMLARALAALETPDDLSKDDIEQVIEDASAMLAVIDGIQDEPTPIEMLTPVVCPYEDELCGGMGLCRNCRRDAVDSSNIGQ